jgi:hypothetical protein
MHRGVFGYGQDGLGFVADQGYSLASAQSIQSVERTPTALLAGSGVGAPVTAVTHRRIGALFSSTALEVWTLPNRAKPWKRAAAIRPQVALALLSRASSPECPDLGGSVAATIVAAAVQEGGLGMTVHLQSAASSCRVVVLMEETCVDSELLRNSTVPTSWSGFANLMEVDSAEFGWTWLLDTAASSVLGQVGSCSEASNSHPPLWLVTGFAASADVSFGASLSLEGDTLAVGAPAGAGRVVVLRRGTALPSDAVGTVRELSARLAVPSLSNAVAHAVSQVPCGVMDPHSCLKARAGVAIRWENVTARWHVAGDVTCQEAAGSCSGSDSFGAVVELRESLLVVSAPTASWGGNVGAGAVFVFAAPPSIGGMFGRTTPEWRLKDLRTPGDAYGMKVVEELWSHLMNGTTVSQTTSLPVRWPAPLDGFAQALTAWFPLVAEPVSGRRPLRLQKGCVVSQPMAGGQLGVSLAVQSRGIESYILAGSPPREGAFVIKVTRPVDETLVHGAENVGALPKGLLPQCQLIERITGFRHTTADQTGVAVAFGDEVVYLGAPEASNVDRSPTASKGRLYVRDYCFSNRYIAWPPTYFNDPEDGGPCKSCPGGAYSPGGVYYTYYCQACPNTRPTSATWRYDALACTYSCPSLRFGSRCEACSAFRARMGHPAPVHASWRDDSSLCAWGCDVGYVLSEGRCVAPPPPSRFPDALALPRNLSQSFRIALPARTFDPQTPFVLANVSLWQSNTTELRDTLPSDARYVASVAVSWTPLTRGGASLTDLAGVSLPTEQDLAQLNASTQWIVLHVPWVPPSFAGYVTVSLSNFGGPSLPTVVRNPVSVAPGSLSVAPPRRFFALSMDQHTDPVSLPDWLRPRPTLATRTHTLAPTVQQFRSGAVQVSWEPSVDGAWTSDVEVCLSRAQANCSTGGFMATSLALQPYLAGWPLLETRATGMMVPDVLGTYDAPVAGVDLHSPTGAKPRALVLAGLLGLREYGVAIKVGDWWSPTTVVAVPPASTPIPPSLSRCEYVNGSLPRLTFSIGVEAFQGGLPRMVVYSQVVAYRDATSDVLYPVNVSANGSLAVRWNETVSLQRTGTVEVAGGFTASTSCALPSWLRYEPVPGLELLRHPPASLTVDLHPDVFLANTLVSVAASLTNGPGLESSLGPVGVRCMVPPPTVPDPPSDVVWVSLAPSNLTLRVGAPPFSGRIPVRYVTLDVVSQSHRVSLNVSHLADVRIMSLWAETDYCISARAVNDQGPSLWSPPSCNRTGRASPPGPVVGPPSLSTVGSVLLAEWQSVGLPNGAAVGQYEMEVLNVTSGGVASRATVNSPDPVSLSIGPVRNGSIGALLPGIPPTTIVQVRVRAVSPAGAGGWSPLSTSILVPAGVVPGTPPPPRLTREDGPSLDLHWQPPLEQGSTAIAGFFVRVGFTNATFGRFTNASSPAQRTAYVWAGHACNVSNASARWLSATEVAAWRNASDDLLTNTPDPYRQCHVSLSGVQAGAAFVTRIKAWSRETAGNWSDDSDVMITGPSVAPAPPFAVKTEAAGASWVKACWTMGARHGGAPPKTFILSVSQANDSVFANRTTNVPASSWTSIPDHLLNEEWWSSRSLVGGVSVSPHLAGWPWEYGAVAEGASFWQCATIHGLRGGRVTVVSVAVESDAGTGNFSSDGPSALRGLHLHSLITTLPMEGPSSPGPVTITRNGSVLEASFACPADWGGPPLDESPVVRMRLIPTRQRANCSTVTVLQSDAVRRSSAARTITIDAAQPHLRFHETAPPLVPDDPDVTTVSLRESMGLVLPRTATCHVSLDGLGTTLRNASWGLEVVAANSLGEGPPSKTNIPQSVSLCGPSPAHPARLVVAAVSDSTLRWDLSSGGSDSAIQTNVLPTVSFWNVSGTTIVPAPSYLSLSDVHRSDLPLFAGERRFPVERFDGTKWVRCDECVVSDTVSLQVVPPASLFATLRDRAAQRSVAAPGIAPVSLTTTTNTLLEAPAAVCLSMGSGASVLFVVSWRDALSPARDNSTASVLGAIAPSTEWNLLGTFPASRGFGTIPVHAFEGAPGSFQRGVAPWATHAATDQHSPAGVALAVNVTLQVQIDHHSSKVVLVTCRPSMAVRTAATGNVVSSSSAQRSESLARIQPGAVLGVNYTAGASNAVVTVSLPVQSSVSPTEQCLSLAVASQTLPVNVDLPDAGLLEPSLCTVRVHWSSLSVRLPPLAAWGVAAAPRDVMSLTRHVLSTTNTTFSVSFSLGGVDLGETRVATVQRRGSTTSAVSLTALNVTGRFSSGIALEWTINRWWQPAVVNGYIACAWSDAASPRPRSAAVTHLSAVSDVCGPHSVSHALAPPFSNGTQVWGLEPGMTYIVGVLGVGSDGPSEWLTTTVMTLPTASLPAAPLSLSVGLRTSSMAVVRAELSPNDGGASLTSLRCALQRRDSSWTLLRNQSFPLPAASLAVTGLRAGGTFRIGCSVETDTLERSAVTWSEPFASSPAAPASEPTFLAVDGTALPAAVGACLVGDAVSLNSTGPSWVAVRWEAPTTDGGADVIGYAVAVEVRGGEFLGFHAPLARPALGWEGLSPLGRDTAELQRDPARQYLMLPNVTRTIIRGLPPSADVTVRVAAVNVAGVGGFATVAARTLAADPNAFLTKPQVVDVQRRTRLEHALDMTWRLSDAMISRGVFPAGFVVSINRTATSTREPLDVSSWATVVRASLTPRPWTVERVAPLLTSDGIPSGVASDAVSDTPASLGRLGADVASRMYQAAWEASLADEALGMNDAALPLPAACRSALPSDAWVPIVESRAIVGLSALSLNDVRASVGQLTALSNYSVSVASLFTSVSQPLGDASVSDAQTPPPLPDDQAAADVPGTRDALAELARRALLEDGNASAVSMAVAAAGATRGARSDAFRVTSGAPTVPSRVLVAPVVQSVTGSRATVSWPLPESFGGRPLLRFEMELRDLTEVSLTPFHADVAPITRRVVNATLLVPSNATDTTPFARGFTVVGTTVTVLVQGLRARHSYSFRVRAINAVGFARNLSDWSAASLTGAPTAPSNVGSLTLSDMVLVDDAMAVAPSENERLPSPALYWSGLAEGSPTAYPEAPSSHPRMKSSLSEPLDARRSLQFEPSHVALASWSAPEDLGGLPLLCYEVSLRAVGVVRNPCHPAVSSVLANMTALGRPSNVSALWSSDADWNGISQRIARKPFSDLVYRPGSTSSSGFEAPSDVAGVLLALRGQGQLDSGLWPNDAQGETEWGSLWPQGALNVTNTLPRRFQSASLSSEWRSKHGGPFEDGSVPPVVPAWTRLLTRAPDSTPSSTGKETAWRPVACVQTTHAAIAVPSAGAVEVRVRPITAQVQRVGTTTLAQASVRSWLPLAEQVALTDILNRMQLMQQNGTQRILVAEPVVVDDATTRMMVPRRLPARMGLGLPGDHHSLPVARGLGRRELTAAASQSNAGFIELLGGETRSGSAGGESGAFPAVSAVFAPVSTPKVLRTFTPATPPWAAPMPSSVKTGASTLHLSLSVPRYSGGCPITKVSLYVSQGPVAPTWPGAQWDRMEVPTVRGSMSDPCMLSAEPSRFCNATAQGGSPLNGFGSTTVGVLVVGGLVRAQSIGALVTVQSGINASFVSNRRMGVFLTTTSALPSRAVRDLRVDPTLSNPVTLGLSWLPPLDNGGLTVLGWGVLVARAGSGMWVSGSFGVTSMSANVSQRTSGQLSGLQPSTMYDVQMMPLTSLGTGEGAILSNLRTQDPIPCPLNCSGHGSCHAWNGQCACHIATVGAGCDKYAGVLVRTFSNQAADSVVPAEFEAAIASLIGALPARVVVVAVHSHEGSLTNTRVDFVLAHPLFDRQTNTIPDSVLGARRLAAAELMGNGAEYSPVNASLFLRTLLDTKPQLFASLGLTSVMLPSGPTSFSSAVVTELTVGYALVTMNCREVASCDACTRATGCGWCAATQSCLQGIAIGVLSSSPDKQFADTRCRVMTSTPTVGAAVYPWYIHPESSVAIQRTCPVSCASLGQCSDCSARSDCVWCESLGRCMARSDAGISLDTASISASLTGRQADDYSASIAPTLIGSNACGRAVVKPEVCPNTRCNTNRNLYQCISDPGCGWCNAPTSSTQNKCSAGNSFGPTPPNFACPAGMYSYGSRQVCSAASCKTCMQLTMCGWCDTTQQCVAANVLSGLPSAGHCDLWTPPTSSPLQGVPPDVVITNRMLESASTSTIGTYYGTAAKMKLSCPANLLPGEAECGAFRTCTECLSNAEGSAFDCRWCDNSNGQAFCTSAIAGATKCPRVSQSVRNPLLGDAQHNYLSSKRCPLSCPSSTAMKTREGVIAFGSLPLEGQSFPSGPEMVYRPTELDMCTWVIDPVAESVTTTGAVVRTDYPIVDVSIKVFALGKNDGILVFDGLRPLTSATVLGVFMNSSSFGNARRAAAVVGELGEQERETVRAIVHAGIHGRGLRSVGRFVLSDAVTVYTEGATLRASSGDAQVVLVTSQNGGGGWGFHASYAAPPVSDGQLEVVAMILAAAAGAAVVTLIVINFARRLTRRFRRGVQDDGIPLTAPAETRTNIVMTQALVDAFPVFVFERSKAAETPLLRKKSSPKPDPEKEALAPRSAAPLTEPEGVAVDDLTCPVCMCEYLEGDQLRSLVCGHSFHCSCIDKWMVERGTCPMCRSDTLEMAVMLLSMRDAGIKGPLRFGDDVTIVPPEDVPRVPILLRLTQQAAERHRRPERRSILQDAIPDIDDDLDEEQVEDDHHQADEEDVGHPEAMVSMSVTSTVTRQLALQPNPMRPNRVIAAPERSRLTNVGPSSSPLMDSSSSDFMVTNPMRRRE